MATKQVAHTKKNSKPRVKKTPRKALQPRQAGTVRVYSLDVFLLSGPIPKGFVKENPVVERTIKIRGDQTLKDLHYAIFYAFEREEQHAYEFQFGKGPMDPEARRYVLPGAFEVSVDDGAAAAGRVDQTTLDSLKLKVGSRFGYWFDFGDDWWHQINVEAIEDMKARGGYPKVTKQLGDSPPQYADLDEEENGDDPPSELGGSTAADAACLVGEMHLKKGDHTKAVEAFTRAIESNPTADAYEGRASAYRALAAADERAARGLR